MYICVYVDITSFWWPPVLSQAFLFRPKTRSWILCTYYKLLVSQRERATAVAAEQPFDTGPPQTQHAHRDNISRSGEPPHSDIGLSILLMWNVMGTSFVFCLFRIRTIFTQTSYILCTRSQKLRTHFVQTSYKLHTNL